MKKNNKRERFFEESLKLIHEKGFKATTMRDIAEKMEFEVANIYNYIDSKQSLLEIFLFDISEEYHKGMDDIYNSSYAPSEKLKAVIALHVRLPSQKPYHIGLLVNEWRHLKGRKLEIFHKGRVVYENKLKSILEEGIESGEFRDFNIEITMHSIFSSMRWIYDWYTDDGIKINPFELEKQMTDFIFRGVLVEA